MEPVALHNITCRYENGRTVYRDFSVSFPHGSITAIAGKSGCGKTTLLNAIASKMNVSYLFQEPRLLPWYTIEKNIQLVLDRSASEQEKAAITGQLLTQVGLFDRRTAFPGELSGGEQQRAALARAFAYRAPVLLLDEAFQSQDTVLKLKLMDIFLSLLSHTSGEKRTVVLVTHDIREALCLADRIMVIDGQPAARVFDEAVPPSGKPVFDTYINPPDIYCRMERTILGLLGASFDAPH